MEVVAPRDTSPLQETDGSPLSPMAREVNFLDDDDDDADGSVPSPLRRHGVRPSLREIAVATAVSSVRWLVSGVRLLPVVGPAVASALPPSVEGPPAGPCQADERRRKMNEFLRDRHREFLSPGELKVHMCTWNVAVAAPPSADAISEWLCVADPSTMMPDGELPDIVAVTLQEAELSGTALVLESTEAVASWSEAIQTSLNRRLQREAQSDPKLVGAKTRFRKVEAVQLVGMILLLFARGDHVPHIRNVRRAITRTGALSAFGNKGAIGIRATIYGKRFLFIGAHFAPHDRAVSKRHANYRNSLAELQLDVGDLLDDEVDHCLDRQARQEQATRGTRREVTGSTLMGRLFQRRRMGVSAMRSGHRLIQMHDYVFFGGDLNYRLAGIDYRDVVEAAHQGDYDRLLLHDQLRRGIHDGTIFQAFSEAEVDFAPTYKYDRGTDNFDTSAKRRTPAYTDRILFRFLAADEKVVAPFSPVASRLSKALGRVARPLAPADPLRNLATRARRASVPAFTPQVTRRRQAMSESKSTACLDGLDSTPSGTSRSPPQKLDPISTPPGAHGADGGGATSPVLPANLASAIEFPAPTAPLGTPGPAPPAGFDESCEQALFDSAKAATARQGAEADAASAHSGSSSASLSAAGGMRGLPYILNHLVVDRYCSFQEMRASDHKPVAAAFRAVIVNTDEVRVRRVVFEAAQEIGIDNDDDDVEVDD